MKDNIQLREDVEERAIVEKKDLVVVVVAAREITSRNY